VPPAVIGVIGAGECDAEIARQAFAIGKGIACRGAMLVCGGLSGVMEAACRGARESGGETVGVLPGNDRSEANPHVTVPIATGIGYARNYVIINTADALIAIGGSHGTLSEIGFALKAGKRVVGLHTWDIEGVIKAETPEQAVILALESVGHVDS
jgi:hypothetical protein